MVEDSQPSQYGLQLDSPEQEPPSPGACEGHQLLPDHLQVSPMKTLSQVLLPPPASPPVEL